MTIPKVSCTRIKTTLNQLNGGATPEKMGHIHRGGLHLTNLSDQDALDAMFSNDWFRFAFVRNPYDRLFSAYKSKIGNVTDQQYKWVRSAIKSQNGYQDKDDLEALVSFKDFINYVRDTPDNHRDGHWQSQASILKPEVLTYQFIGRFENFRKDFDTVLDRLDVPEDIRKASTEVLNPTAQIPLSYIYDDESAELVFDMYRSDFISFSYEKDSWKFIY